MIDFLIVGRGLAATVLMHRFHQQHISFKTIGNEHLSSCSKIAAGIWNPIVFKRLTKSWLAEELIKELNIFYSTCELTLEKKVITPRPILKPFTEEQEKTLWLKKSKNELDSFLDSEIYSSTKNELQHCNINNQYSVVKQAGNLNMDVFLNASSYFFKQQIVTEIFEHKELQVLANKIIYKGIEAKNILFCEGFLVNQNPFFNWIPLKPVKGEILDIECEWLQLKNSILNKNGFLMDTEKNTYKFGATYNWDDLTQSPSDKGLTELETKLKQLISCQYTITAHKAGIRPASLDRRPIIGAHPKYQHLFVFNGLGTKGVMLAPFFSKNFVNFYLQKEDIASEVNIKRFYRIYEGL